MHVAAGAATGALFGSRAAAAVLGLGLHGVQDAIPHRDIPSRPFETGCGLFLIGALALRRGPLDPAVVGAAACAAPDLEHVLNLPQPGGRKLYPSHRVEGWHQEGGPPAWTHLLLACVAVAALTRPRAQR